MADALSRKSLHASAMMIKELELIEKFRDLNLAMESTSKSFKLGMLKISNDFMEQIREAPQGDEYLKKRKGTIEKETEIKEDASGFLHYSNRVCVPDNQELKMVILEEAHNSNLSIHPETTKMYAPDLKKMF